MSFIRLFISVGQYNILFFFTITDADIDFESVKYLTISVTATDSSLLNVTSIFNITVLDVNELPTGLTLTNDKV